MAIARCIAVMFEADGAEQLEEHMIVRFDPMDKFKRRCEFTINLTRQIIHNLNSMVQCPEPVKSRHLHVSDVGSSHSNNSLPILFN